MEHTKCLGEGTVHLRSRDTSRSNGHIEEPVIGHLHASIKQPVRSLSQLNKWNIINYLRVWLMDGPALSPSVWYTEIRFWQRKLYSLLIRVGVQPSRLKGNWSKKPVSVAELRKNTALGCANLSPCWGRNSHFPTTSHWTVNNSLDTAVLVFPRDSPVHECTFQLYIFASNSIIMQPLT